MTTIDEKTFFTALGFLAVLLKGKSADKDSAARATAMAQLIESFCRAASPELLVGKDDPRTDELDQLIEGLKASLHTKQLLGLTSDQSLLHRLYDRLLQRHRDYATDDLIAEEIAHLLEEEVKHAAEANMRIVHVQGDPEVFARYEQLATAIADFLRIKGDCFPEDLQEKGFSLAEVERDWTMAYSLAKVELKLMGS
jgi:hypothetical protein